MESNQYEPATALSDLDADRNRLVDRMRAPWWLAPGFGLIGASYVAGPAFEASVRNAIFIAAIVLTIALIAGYRRVTGIRVSGVGLIPWILFGVAVLAVLVLLSVSFGLVSFQLTGWVAATSVVAFALVTALAVLFSVSAQDRVRHGR